MNPTPPYLQPDRPVYALLNSQQGDSFAPKYLAGSVAWRNVPDEIYTIELEDGRYLPIPAADLYPRFLPLEAVSILLVTGQPYSVQAHIQRVYPREHDGMPVYVITLDTFRLTWYLPLDEARDRMERVPRP